MVPNGSIQRNLLGRRNFLGMMSAAALSRVLPHSLESAVASARPKSHPDSRPNIIFFLIDDLGYGDLGCYGNTFCETPNIDRLARDGMRFTNAYASAPVCSPS